MLQQNELKELVEWTRLYFRSLLPASSRVLPTKEGLFVNNPEFLAITPPIRLRNAQFSPGIGWDTKAAMTVKRLKVELRNYIQLAVEKLVSVCAEETDRRKDKCSLVCVEPMLSHKSNDNYEFLLLEVKSAFVSEIDFLEPEEGSDKMPSNKMWSDPTVGFATKPVKE